MYIAFALAAVSALVVWRVKPSLRDTMPYTTAILMFIVAFFLAVMGFLANPFEKLPFVPLDGDGINPLLGNIALDDGNAVGHDDRWAGLTGPPTRSGAAC